MPEGFTDKTPKYIVKMYQERYEKKLITGRVHETDERYVAHNKKNDHIQDQRVVASCKSQGKPVNDKTDDT